MLDYYGSIIMKRDEINSYLLERYKKEANEKFIQSVICDLRIKNIIFEEYSVSGWHCFHCSDLIKLMNKIFQGERERNEKKLKFIYCYSLLFPDKDVGILIGEKI